MDIHDDYLDFQDQFEPSEKDVINWNEANDYVNEGDDELTQVEDLEDEEPVETTEEPEEDGEGYDRFYRVGY